MITTNEKQERLIDEYGALINPSAAKALRDAGLGIVESKKQGAYVWDQSGTRYIDCRENMSVFNIGRLNPFVTNAIKESLNELDLGNTLYFSEVKVLLAKKLGELSPGRKLTGVAFGVSGGEIVDFAIKMARALTGRHKVIAMENAYHGCTGFAVSASGEESLRQPFKPLVSEYKHVRFGDSNALAKAIDDHTACVIVEPIQGHAGVKLPPPGYLKAVRRLCDEHGVIMIVDEIQTGLGRTGDMFACDYYGVVPDIMTIGKSLSGGIYPITAALFKRKFLQFWNDHPFSHLTSFGGADLGCCAALAAIQYIEENLLVERVSSLQSVFANGFKKLLEKYPKQLKDFRQKGLLMAVDYTDQAVGVQMSRDLTQQGILGGFSPMNPTTMRIMPSLTITEEDAHAIITGFDNALAGFSYMSGQTSPEIDSMLQSLQG